MSVTPTTPTPTATPSMPPQPNGSEMASMSEEQLLEIINNPTAYTDDTRALALSFLSPASFQAIISSKNGDPAFKQLAQQGLELKNCRKHLESRLDARMKTES